MERRFKDLKKRSTDGVWIRANKKPREAIIDGFLYTKETMLLYGQSGSGKSTFMLELVDCLATGRDFLGQKVHKAMKVCVIDGEMSHESLDERIRTPEADIEYVNGDILNFDLDFRREHDREDIVDYVLEQKFEVVVLDSVRTLFHMTNENEAGAWNTHNLMIRSLRDAGLIVIVLHHANKSNDYSGSTNAITVFERVIRINNGGDNNRSLMPQKVRGPEWGDWLEDACITMSEETGVQYVDSVDAQIEQRDKVINLLKGNTDRTPKDKRVKRQAINKLLGLKLGNQLTNEAIWKEIEHLFLDYWNRDAFEQAMDGNVGGSRFEFDMRDEVVFDADLGGWRK